MPQETNIARIDKEDTSGLDRLNTEWAFIVALRETAGIALKGEKQPTYLQSLSLARELFPKLFDEHSLLLRQEESDVAREYRQFANAETTLQEQEVSPLMLLDADIKKYERLIDTDQETDKLKHRLIKMQIARQELAQAKHTEQQLILRDAIRSHRKYPISGEGRDYREFKLSHDRVLRIRVLHPDKPEHLMGADVIYESYWDDKKLVKIAVVQYKLWEGRVLYKDDRMAKQLERMKKSLCNRNFCQHQENNNRYRLPYCAAFLRPTDKLQAVDSKLVSTGYHTPICVIDRCWEKGPQGGTRITSKHIRSETVTHKVFEELFNCNLLGSRWVKYSELENLYREMSIFEKSERILIHAQELG